MIQCLKSSKKKRKISDQKRLLPTPFKAMKAIFDNLTSVAGRRAEQEYNTNSAAHCEADSIKVNVKSVRLSTQMHVTDWAEAHCEDPGIKATRTAVTLTRRNQSHGWSSW